MARYDALRDHLMSCPEDEVTMTFIEIGGLVGELPQSATDHRPWWGNERGHVQAEAWLDAGYEVAEVDQGLGIVRFRRRVPNPGRQGEVGAKQEAGDRGEAPPPTEGRARSTFGENLRENLQHAATQISGAAQRAAQSWRASREQYQRRMPGGSPRPGGSGRIRYPGSSSPDGRWTWNGADWVPTPLPHQIALWQSRGYFVTSQTEMAASLMKPKHFSFIWALFWFLWRGVGVLVYVFYYVSKSDHHIYLSVPAAPPPPSNPMTPTPPPSPLPPSSPV